VFKYIEDKDVYQKFYSRMLAKRLLYANDISEDIEMRMIGRLKDACDMKFTSNLQRMVQDIHVSRDLDMSFKLYQDCHDTEKSTIDNTFCILYAGFWPLSAPKTTFEPPKPIQDSCHQFETFYGTRYEGRRLRWLWQLCKGEIRAKLQGPNGNTSYVFLVSIYQMAILLLFNDQTTISHEEIARGTALAESVLGPSLGALVKARVFHAIPATARPGPGSSYGINHGFKSRRLRVNLQIAIKSEQKQELEDTHKANREDRRLIIQVCLRFEILVPDNFSSSMDTD
jgi:cullin 1